MSHYSYHIAKAMGLPEHHATLFLHAAPMHDVGKIGIPDSILLKPGPLTPEEWTVMRMHCEIGSKIIGTHDYDVLREAAACALSHHEKWDGSGYPKGLSGNTIPLVGRVVAVADVFDALTQRRPYREARSVQDAFQWIKNHSGTHFDPTVVRAFAEAYPQILESKEQHAEPGRPKRRPGSIPAGPKPATSPNTMSGRQDPDATRRA